MHWNAPNYQNVTVYTQPSPALIDLLISQQRDTSIHIFSGLRSNKTGTIAIELCREQGIKVVVMAEAGDWNGHGKAKYLRLLKHYLLRARYRSNIQRILAIGDLGVQWYRRVGYSPNLLTPFAYFVEPPRIPLQRPRVEVELLFVGRSVPYKGGSLLLETLSHLRFLPWHATFITEGPERARWEAQALQNGIADRVTFENFEPPYAIAQRMANATALVLPNTADEGWGVVVNEALFQGTPVICTTLTGAKDMLQGNVHCGQVVAPDVPSLRAALEKQIVSGPPSEVERETIAQHIRMHWSGQAAAQRLLDAVGIPSKGMPTAASKVNL